MLQQNVQQRSRLLGSLSTLHGFLSRLRRDFENDANQHSAKFYRMMNEVPTLLLVVIVIMVIVKPF